MSGGGKGTTQTSEVDVPGWARRTLQLGNEEARQIIEGSEGLRQDPSQIVAPFDPAQERAFEQIEAGIGEGANPYVDIARNTLGGVAGGDLTGGPIDINPYFNQAYDAASDAATRRYQETIAPTIAGNASMAGRFGSPAHERAVQNAQRELADSLTNLAGGMSYNMYGNERSRQLQEAGLRAQAAGAIPALEGQRFVDQNILAGVGGQRQALEQAQREAQLTVPYATLNPAIGWATPGIAAADRTAQTNPGFWSNMMGYTTGLANLGLAGAGMGLYGPWARGAGGVQTFGGGGPGQGGGINLGMG